MKKILLFLLLACFSSVHAQTPYTDTFSNDTAAVLWVGWQGENFLSHTATWYSELLLAPGDSGSMLVTPALAQNIFVAVSNAPSFTPSGLTFYETPDPGAQTSQISVNAQFQSVPGFTNSVPEPTSFFFGTNSGTASLPADPSLLFEAIQSPFTTALTWVIGSLAVIAVMLYVRRAINKPHTYGPETRFQRIDRIRADRQFASYMAREGHGRYNPRNGRKWKL